MKVAGLVVVVLVAMVTIAVAADPEGQVFARSGGIQVDADETARWKALVDSLRRQREALETELADTRALLLKALRDLEQRTKERDAARLVPERKEGREPQRAPASP